MLVPSRHVWPVLLTLIAGCLTVTADHSTTRPRYSFAQLDQEERRIIGLGRYTSVGLTAGLDAIVITPDARYFGVAPGQRISPRQEAADRTRLHSRFPISYEAAGMPVTPALTRAWQACCTRR